MADFSKWPFFKIANSQYFFVKISWIGHWVSRIDWCKGHWWSSTYMVVRLSDIISETGKKCIFVVFRPILSLQSHGHTGWATSMPFASINPTNPRTNPWNFGGNCTAFGDVEKLSFFESAIFFAWFPWKSVTNYVMEWMGLNFDVLPGFQQISCYA